MSAAVRTAPSPPAENEVLLAAEQPSLLIPRFDLVALATSAGGLAALTELLSHLPAEFPAAIAVVQHLAPHGPCALAAILGRRTPLRVRAAEEGDRLQPGTVYFAPPDRHLRITLGRALALGQDERVQFSRPAADPLFESAASSFGPRALGVVLTGCGEDGAAGVRAIRSAGGTVIAQDPSGCHRASMPRAAIRTGCVDFVLSLPAIAPALLALVTVPGAAQLFGIPLPALPRR
jgi:two-component system, chemotaxis family, protein-glutamate methylesterase/glutaminase